MPLITQNFAGQVGDHHNSPSHPIDQHHSRAFGRSTYANFNHGVRHNRVDKPSDDKVITGYNRQGLPFQIIVDGFFGGETKLLFKFIDLQVLPLIDDYADGLSQAENSTQLSSELIQKIALLRSRATGIEFTLSIVTTYQKNNQIYAAGFGIGDTAIICKRANGTIEQLVSHVKIIDDNRESKDAFDEFSSLTTPHNVRVAISRSGIFETPLDVNDELVGYTSLPLPMEQVFEEIESENILAGRALQRVQKLHFNPSSLISPPNKDLFSQLVESIDFYFDEQCKQASDERFHGSFGDDATIASIIVPDPELQNQLRIRIAIRTATEDYLGWKDTHKRGITAFFSSESSQKRAQNIGDMIDGGLSHEEICQSVVEAFSASSCDRHSYSRYLVEALSNEKALSMSKADFSKIKSEINLKTILAMPDEVAEQNFLLN